MVFFFPVSDHFAYIMCDPVSSILVNFLDYEWLLVGRAMITV